MDVRYRIVIFRFPLIFFSRYWELWFDVGWWWLCNDVRTDWSLKSLQVEMDDVEVPGDLKC